MISKNELKRLAEAKGAPCVTISLNTHRSHPENLKDEITLKNFVKEAKERVVAEFGKKTTADLLDKLDQVSGQVHRDYNLDSLHVFVSNDTMEIVQSIWTTRLEGVQISEHFALRPLIKMYVQEQDYMIMTLTQGGVNLYLAQNDHIESEVINDDFPLSENPHYLTNAEQASDGKRVDNMVKEYFNKVDKALGKMANDNGLSCVVICTEDNYSKLMQVADHPARYMGYTQIDYNNLSKHQIASQAWKFMLDIRREREQQAVEELHAATGAGLLFTDLQEIFQASMDGRADLLVVESDFSQSVVMADDRSFSLVEDATAAGAIDDIVSVIAWQVLSQNGRVVFAQENSLGSLGKIALKTRY
ncbi:baeRF3 domain-containing protein [Sphingobacterium griseoflavum]|uniref:Uncharacterized protein n=1 Tax=Sphingobacterium griseoflavum TaxID=1474952 RepID=A0ABQ3HTV3_9SPHI|nr:hypothetical protein [Sphingobacterium griseoflavum]GHE33991.1 hypothetical protein GCM10017764_16610 [Sphingobacterium griseoflavum]